MPDALECDYDSYHYVDYVFVYRRETRGGWTEGERTFLEVRASPASRRWRSSRAARRGTPWTRTKARSMRMVGGVLLLGGASRRGRVSVTSPGGGDEYTVRVRRRRRARARASEFDAPRGISASRETGRRLFWRRTRRTASIGRAGRCSCDRAGGIIPRPRGEGSRGRRRRRLERSRRFDRVDRAPRRETLRLFDEAPGFSGGGGRRAPGGRRAEEAVGARGGARPRRSSEGSRSGSRRRTGGEAGGVERGSERAYDRV